MTETLLAPRRWPLSNDFVLLSVLLLLATGAGFVVARQVSEQFATYAYYSLVAGVSLRVVELAVGDRLTGAAGRARSGLGTGRLDVRSETVFGLLAVVLAVGVGGALVYWYRFAEPGAPLRPDVVLLYLVGVVWAAVRYWAMR